MDRIYVITTFSNEFLNFNFAKKFTGISPFKNLCQIIGVLKYFTFQFIILELSQSKFNRKKTYRLQTALKETQRKKVRSQGG